MHIHVGAFDMFITWAYVILLAYIWRSLSAHWSENPVGQAMAFIF